MAPSPGQAESSGAGRIRRSKIASCSSVSPSESERASSSDNALLKSVAKELLLVPDTFINIHDVLPENLPHDLVEMDEARDVTATAVA